ncbi:hydroxymethylglutaryl-CoA lyase [Mucilaginibacter flavidus]|uniref:hydroxymethylglutaryl-CoA lyase n=1 Tax=Mucilaginibacter flavidus TaxID=2949309 RepID=UPI002093D056|nr:hydroxymethylglutaryl-CoA lyase [Mucilaginibacter flavidus]MCO5948707.1 hydroxymethylglutaryl-CoA lyase [Mucilaginibacter flavidus]
MTNSPVKITECPRDAMQGLHDFIPTDKKATYINLLLQVGFDTIDFGSFVSPKAIPQMRDTAELLAKLDLSTNRSKLLAIIANYRGAEDAVKHPEITYLGFPYSISETFQQRNTNSGIAKSFETLENIYDLCERNNKKVRAYMSMGFGNPYGDPWNIDLLVAEVDNIISAGIFDIYIADTIGIASSEQISTVFKALSERFINITFGLHLHSTPNTWSEKITAAYKAGCRMFDTTIKGYGGCPMAADDLTGNIATENLIGYLQAQNEPTGLDMGKFREAMEYAGNIFI